VKTSDYAKSTCFIATTNGTFSVVPSTISAATAKERAERIYPGLSACWVDAHVSEEEAERYQDELYGDNRCNFCGKRPDQVEQLIQKNEARICDRCIDEFHVWLHEAPPK